MGKSIKYFDGGLAKRFLLIGLLAAMLLGFSVQLYAQTENQDKATVALQVARKWITVGTEQYKRRLYGPAEKSFLFANDYKDYLPATEQDKLKQMLEDTRKAAAERISIQEHIDKASQLVKEENYAEAKTHLEAIKDNQFLTDQEKALVTESLTKIQGKAGVTEKPVAQIKADDKKAIADIYNTSVDLFKAGKYQEAKEGFLKVAQSNLLNSPEGYTANDYLAKIEKALSEPKAVEPKVPATIEPKTAPIEPNIITAEPKVPAAEPNVVENATFKGQVVVQPEESKKDQDSYIAQVQGRINLIRGHVQAVVNDTMSQCKDCIDANDYTKARVVIEDAQNIVHQNNVALGNDLFKQYCDQLKQLSEDVELKDAALQKQLEDTKRQAALDEQQKFRQAQELERAKRVEDLLNNANTYQKEQRYEEALGQLQLLLAIDPQNDEALTQKQTLEDLISFRKDLSVQKERDLERVKLLRENDATKISYAEEMTHPKNWAELIAKRQPEASLGQNPADMAVYSQLEEVVNLSSLSPDMSFNDAIEELKNSVNPPLKIVVLWKDLLDNADVDKTTPINMDSQPSIRLGTALELLLKSVSGGLTEINYSVENGVVTIGTTGALPVKMVTQVYDITVLLGKTADYATNGGGGRRQGGGGGNGGGGGMGGGGGGGIQQEDFDEYDEEYDQQNQETAADKTAATKEREGTLISLIKETVSPESWFENGGEGTIKVYQQKKLIVYQTRENHRKVDELLKDLSKALGHEISIESRFLLVTENFIEDIGIDLDFIIKPDSDNWGLIQVDQGSYTAVAPIDQGFKGSFAGARGMDVSASYWGSILGNLQANLLIRALQGHADATSLTAPKATVLDGESARFTSSRVIRFALPPNTDYYDNNYGGGGSSSQNVRQRSGRVSTRVDLNVTPTITPDKTHVLLNIVADLQDFLGFQVSSTQTINNLGQVVNLEQTLPQTERSSIRTRVSVPDCGTLLLGGLKLSAEAEREAGVPILGKLPIVGAAFRNKSNIKDNKILLILVKPTIILQEEKDAEALDRLENSM